MTYRKRVSLLVLIDTFFIIIAVIFGGLLVSQHFTTIDLTLLGTVAIILLSHQSLAIYYKLYHKAWEYASVGELIIILRIVTFSIVAATVFQFIINQHVQLNHLIVSALLYLTFICGSRFAWRVGRDRYIQAHHRSEQAIIIGAGAAGTMVVRQLLQNNETEMLPVAFVDDDVKKHSLHIYGIPVVGSTKHIEEIVRSHHVKNIIIAIPSLGRQEIKRIFHLCSKTKAKTHVLPKLEDLVSGKLSVSQFREVQVEDLLGREPVELDTASISEYITNKVVLVTGAGGSVGSEICRQVSAFNPQIVVLLGHGENSIYTIEMQLKSLYKDRPIQFLTEIADIQDQNKMKKIMMKYQPHVVYHAAAHKHVPLMERNPEEAVKNNIIGTMNTAEAAKEAMVDTFVLISSDKAVNPTSVMGSTKRLAEMVIQHINHTCHTKFIAVRFGNVLGSRGSVIPLFKAQIEKGGPVTVTHPDMVRYFMTIPEASKLVLQAGSLAEGGEIFVLDMGEPVKIVDLAKNLINLSGNSVEDIGIEFTGIRPGEKLFEELLNENEVQDKQVHPKIYIGAASEVFMEDMMELVHHIEVLEKEELSSKLLEIANRKTSSEQEHSLLRIPV